MVQAAGFDQRAKEVIASPKESRAIVKQLLGTRLFAKLERAFSDASGLPLTLRPIGAFRQPAANHRRENPFCALMGQSRKGCLACLTTQADLESQAEKGCTATCNCFAQLSDSLIPVRSGKRVIAFLQTGQVRINSAQSDDFERAHSELILRGIEFPRTQLHETWSKSVRMPKETYQAFLKLLELYADNLGAAANALMTSKADRSKSPVIAKAIKHIQGRLNTRLRLDDVAQASGASPRHFRKLFKESTGLTFLDYVTRCRVETAKARLAQSGIRVSEIAFESGFESIAQFNRAFRKTTGQTPTAYRLNAGDGEASFN